MNVEELWGKAVSLRPDQNPMTMEFLGMIVRNGVRYRYYRDEGGEILYDSEPEEGKPEWMLRADRASRKRYGCLLYTSSLCIFPALEVWTLAVAGVGEGSTTDRTFQQSG